MKLFLPNGFIMDTSAETYSDDVLRFGNEADGNLYRFFGELCIKRNNGSSVLKHLRNLHSEGKLDMYFKAYTARVSVGGIQINSNGFRIARMVSEIDLCIEDRQFPPFIVQSSQATPHFHFTAHNVEAPLRSGITSRAREGA
ncbi:unnamed protein product [Phytophthora fragariaefolia]|uniref:Unnamed protein product n=1 Tax=Phytophthora fragariaefolia TaxID=1490495 RepID=A0A9W6Y8Z1_9STRA|nr:unnamed protein product [Phytophthora fragariaefolia]